MTRRVKRPPEPYDDFEADIWPLYDRIKSALDRQSEHRKSGTLNTWLPGAVPLWTFLTDMERTIRDRMPEKSALAYGFWLTARGLDAWLPPTDGPLTWTAPGLNAEQRYALWQYVNAEKEARESEFNDLRKQILKAGKARMAADRRALKKTLKAQKENVNG